MRLVEILTTSPSFVTGLGVGVCAAIFSQQE